jgi:hypothetical protein
MLDCDYMIWQILCHYDSVCFVVVILSASISFDRKMKGKERGREGKKERKRKNKIFQNSQPHCQKKKPSVW